MEDKRTEHKITHAERELIRCFANAELSSKVFTQDYWLNRAVEQEAIIKKLKGK